MIEITVLIDTSHWKFSLKFVDSSVKRTQSTSPFTYSLSVVQVDIFVDLAD